MPLNYEQFKKLRQSGISVDEIIQQEKSGTLQIPTITQPKEKEPIGYTIGKTLAPIGETLGRTLGIGYAQKLGRGLEAQQQELTNQVIKRIRDPNITPEQKEKYVSKLKEINPDIVSQIPELKQTLQKTTGQIIGETAITGLSMLAGGVATGYRALSGVGRIGYGAGLGGLYGAFSGMEVGKTGQELAKSFSIGAAIGGILSLGGEAVGSLIKKLQKIPAKATARAIGVKPKDVEKSFYYGTENVADKMVKEGYRGSATKIANTARTNLSKYGQQIDDLLDQYSDRTINKGQVIGKITDIMDDPFLIESQRKGIQKILDVIPDSMNPQQANALKIKFAKAVPSRYWTSIDPSTSFKGDFYKKLSGAFRASIEEALPEATIKVLNDKWAVARSVLELLSEKGAKQFTQSQGFYGLGTVINKIVQSTLASTRWRTVGITGGANLFNRIAEQMSKLSPVEKNLILRFITKSATPMEKPIKAPDYINQQF